MTQIRTDGSFVKKNKLRIPDSGPTFNSEKHNQVTPGRQIANKEVNLLRKPIKKTQQISKVFLLRNECNVTVAKGQYDEKYKDNHLYDCGLVVNPEFSVLGATADGKLCSNGTTEILEIKTRMLLETSELKRQLSQLNGVNEDFVVPSLQRNIIEGQDINLGALFIPNFETPLTHQ
ncbi:unnamed protein product [Mytilus edulis]|uniref:YqaJ viral recombinase domain-containing protein n=1 Tax=Mytilus edulis TaxID=6550 RepID=A0A8S3QZX0_MYTED|nr:unnamed protein product [Mytilus edulis]